MSRFISFPPNGDSRKVIEQRAREAMRPAAPEKKESWPFNVDKNPSNGQNEERPLASIDRAGKSG